MGVGGISLKDEDRKGQEVEPSKASDEVEELPDDIYTKPLSLTQATTIRQRLDNPEFQATVTSELFPRHKHLLIKRSQRCRECEHNLSKPEFNPASIKFKIQLVALHHVPEIRLMSLPNLQLNKESQLILTMNNPLDSVAHVTLLPSNVEKDDWSTAKVELPTCELAMAARDDAADFDENSDPQEEFKDDPSVVVFRKSNKIGFFVKVTPQEADRDVKIRFDMRYDYRNMKTALQSDNKEPEVVWLQHPLLLNLGPLTP